MVQNIIILSPETCAAEIIEFPHDLTI